MTTYMPDQGSLISCPSTPIGSTLESVYSSPVFCILVLAPLRFTNDCHMVALDASPNDLRLSGL